jgi:hypothetical protein
MPMGIDQNLAARLQQLGPVSVTRPESRIPAKVSPRIAILTKADDMLTILRNRANISQALDEEAQGSKNELRKHVPIAILKEIVRAKERGWESSRISKEYKVDISVVQKLEKHIAIPADNADGVVCSLMTSINCRVCGHRNGRNFKK